MKMGYPCINRSVACRGNSTFRLKSFHRERFITTLQANLDCLQTILEFNVRHHLLFFRISSDLVPFASHGIMTVDWRSEFKDRFREIGGYIKANDIRISMHPGQYTVLNSTSEDVVRRSVAELEYHAQVLELMELGEDAKIQLHVGGVYGDKPAALQRFVRNYQTLSSLIRRYLVVENDEHYYGFDDCLSISKETGIPVLFDVFHERIYTPDFILKESLQRQRATWSAADGIPMLDYSSPKPDGKKGAHAEQLDCDDFRRFMQLSGGFDFDLMLEIKSKEKAALEALKVVQSDSRLNG